VRTPPTLHFCESLDQGGQEDPIFCLDAIPPVGFLVSCRQYVHKETPLNGKRYVKRVTGNPAVWYYCQFKDGAKAPSANYWWRPSRSLWVL